MEYDRCLPLTLTNNMAEKYTNLWQIINTIRTRHSDEWDNICYIPISATLAITTSTSNQLTDNAQRDANIIAAVASWRLHKQIYSFDTDLQDLLFAQSTDDLVIPVEVLRNLPYQCIYIQLDWNNLNGFFVFFESDTKTKGLELRILVCYNSLDILSVPLHIKSGYTVRDAVLKSHRIILKNMTMADKKIATAENINKSIKFQTEVASNLLQLILYICADNSQISENTEQKKIYKKPISEARIKDRYNEIQKFDCGKEIGYIIRNIKKTNEHKNLGTEIETESGVKHLKSSPKSPHSRRGHWHHYWTGKINSPSRKLILKWVAPMFINMGTDNNIVTFNNIK